MERTFADRPESTFCFLISFVCWERESSKQVGICNNLVPVFDKKPYHKQNVGQKRNPSLFIPEQIQNRCLLPNPVFFLPVSATYRDQNYQSYLKTYIWVCLLLTDNNQYHKKNIGKKNIMFYFSYLSWIRIAAPSRILFSLCLKRPAQWFKLLFLFRCFCQLFFQLLTLFVKRKIIISIILE